MAWMGLLKVALALVVIYGILPRILFRRPKIARGPVDRFVIDFLRTSAFLVVLVHVLVPLRLFQWTGILLVAGFWTYFVRLRPAGWTIGRLIEKMQWVNEIVLYFVEAGSRAGNERVKRVVREWWRTHVRPRLRIRFTRRHLRILLLSLPLIAVLGVSLAIRVFHPLAHPAFAASDDYVHLAWMRYLEAGELYHDGVYPMGMHAILVVAAKLTHASSYDLLRFAGPIFNVFMVLLLYVVSLRVTRNTGVGLFCAAAVGITGFGNELGFNLMRQMATLPQEFGIVVALAATLMVIEYVARPTRGRLLAIGAGALAVMWIHPLPIGLVGAAVASGGLALLLRQRRLKPVLRLGGTMAVGAGAAIAYHLAAIYGGIGAYGEHRINPVSSPAEPGAATSVGSTATDVGFLSNSLEVAAVVGGMVGFLYALWTLRRGSRSAALPAMLPAFVLVCAAVPASGLVYQWFTERWWEHIVRPILPLGLACAFVPVKAAWGHVRPYFTARPILRPAAVGSGVLLVTMLLALFPPVLVAPEASQIEYDSEARVVRDILRSHERLTYTVVGTPAWYDHVIGMGYHVHLIDFVDELDARDAVDPSFSIPIPTERIFVLAEKETFEFGGNVRNGMLARYYDHAQRGELMRATDEWMRIYDRHHDDVRIYYEDAEIRVWVVEQEPDPDYAKRYGIVDSDALYEDPLEKEFKG